MGQSNGVSAKSMANHQVQVTSSKKTSHVHHRKPNTSVFGTTSFLRMCFIDLPLVLSFALYMTSLGIKDFAFDYLIPQLNLMLFDEEKEGAEGGLTYYHRICSPEDQSTFDAQDLLVTPENSLEEGLEKMLRHGAALLPDLLTEKTAFALRDFILQENQVSQELIYVIENKNRWSFPIQVDQDPTVIAALEELLGNKRLVQLLEQLCGDDPAVIEFTAITAAEGAAKQYWHQDVISEGSGVKYGRHFIPSFSLFVPLQNTTGEMGATGLCPGTHMCSVTDFCEQTGFQVSGSKNLWPMGAGALVNQQTTHRGEAHTMGPHRAVFILTFAPRPRTQDFSVETRMIGQSGSYSLHWSQWGHTLKDFADPSRRMSQPWRALRSLGVYRCAQCQWGWDYLSSTAMRIGNYESGFSNEDAITFVEKGGFPFLPSWFQSQVHKDSENQWLDVLMVTVVKSVKGFQRAYLGMLIVSLLLVVFPVVNRHGKKSLSPLLKIIVPLLLMHVLVLTALKIVQSRIANGFWGRNIRLGQSHEVELPLALAASNATSVLPTRVDVMFFDNMQSEYMAACTDVLDKVHPGNMAFATMIKHFSPGYTLLPSALQKLVRSGLRKDMLWSRFLVQSDQAAWSSASPSDTDFLIHRRLVSATKPVVRNLLQQVDFLQSEVRFGYWRRSAMQRKHVAKLIMDLRKVIFPFQHETSKRGLVDLKRNSHPLYLRGPLAVSISPTMRFPTFNRLPRLNYLLSFEATPQEPYSGAWMRVGDRIESFFDGDTAHWYAGVITAANANKETWDIEFDDGDAELHTCRACVVPFADYKVDEWIQVRLGEDSYGDAQVVAHHKDNTFDLLLETGHQLKNIPPQSLRRVFGTGIEAGSSVNARFPGDTDGTWYPGHISAVNPDGTFAVSYDDGDFAPSVSQKDIQVR